MENARDNCNRCTICNHFADDTFYIRHCDHGRVQNIGHAQMLQASIDLSNDRICNSRGFESAVGRKDAHGNQCMKHCRQDVSDQNEPLSIDRFGDNQHTCFRIWNARCRQAPDDTLNNHPLRQIELSRVEISADCLPALTLCGRYDKPGNYFQIKTYGISFL